MPDFDFEKYEKPSGFDFEKYEKPKGKSNAATIYGREAVSGAAGQIGDVLHAYKALRDKLPNIPGLPPKVPASVAPKTTEQLSQDIQQLAGGREPENILERYAKTGGRFGGQESALGAALGGAAGPVGAGIGGAAGLAHGTFSGLVFQTAKEFGADDDTAMLLTALSTLSPIAIKEYAPKVWAKLKKSNPAALEKALEAPKGNAPGEPPPPGAPPGGAPPAANKVEELLAGKSPETFHETAERAIEQVKAHPEVEKPLGTSSLQIEPIKSEAVSLEGKKFKAEPDLGNAITSKGFESEAQGGRYQAAKVQETAKEQKKPVTEAYKKSEEITKTHNDIYPQAAAENDALISELESVEKRNTAQEQVYQNALAVRRLVGTAAEPIEANAARLMAQADSTSQMANWEMLYGGYKNKAKGIVKNLNNAVIQSLERAGKDASSVLKADKLFSQWADRFLGDEISPFLERKILNPESLFRKSISDEGTYRAVKKAIGSRKDPIIQKIDRALVEEKMGKYFRDPSKVNSEEYIKDLNNLNERIGADKTAEVDALLRKRQKERGAIVEKAQAVKKSGERISPKAAKEAEGRRPLREKVTAATQEKAAKVAKMTPSELTKKLGSPEGIREVKKQLPQNLFKELGDQKLRSVLREGNIEKEVLAEDIYKLLNKEDNYQLFAEFIGKEEVNAARLAAKEASKLSGKQEFTQDIIKRLIKLGVLSSVQGSAAIKGLKEIFRIIEKAP